MEGNPVKKNIISSLLLLTLVMLSVTVLPTSATDYTKVGVRVGDTADYSFSGPNGNGTLQIYVQQIVGTNVTLNMKGMNSNGSNSPNSIVTGNLSGTPNDLFGYLIASNLRQGDSVFPRSTCTIDETTTLIVTGVNRTVNHASYNMSIGGSYHDYYFDAYDYYFDAYWDKTTGLSVKSNVTILGLAATSIGILAGSYTKNLTSTTTFGNKTDPAVLLLTAGVTALLVTATITAYALSKKKATTTN